MQEHLDMSTAENSPSEYSSNNDGLQRLAFNSNIEEVELSLQEEVSLNNEEARALLGRLEYHRGHVESALRVLEGIDVSIVIPKMKLSIARKAKGSHKRRSRGDAPPMSLHAVSLLLEAFYLKAKALSDLGKFNEAAHECSIVLDIVESTLPEGLPPNISTEYNLNDTIFKAVELLPELWKLARFPLKAVISYRRALLGHWNLDAARMARIQKEFAVFLLYGGCEERHPNPYSHAHGSSFTPQNNLEESILILMILLRKITLKKIDWDPSVAHHLSFALSVSGLFNTLANVIEELMPEFLNGRECLFTIALCYLSEKDDITALNLLKRLIKSEGDPNYLKDLLLSSKICGDNTSLASEAAEYAHRALANTHLGCDQLETLANCLLGISLSKQARCSSDYEHTIKQQEALQALEKAEFKMNGNEQMVIYNLSLEYAEQDKLDSALCYAKKILRLEAGANIAGWTLMARILSALKRYTDAEAVLDVALDQAGELEHGELLRTKAKVQTAQGNLSNAVETYTRLLAVIRRRKSSSSGVKFLKVGKSDIDLELETWYDLALLYLSMSQWNDVEICLSRINAINPYSPLAPHAAGKLYEAKGLLHDALGAYSKALDIDPSHVESLVSTAALLRRLGGHTSSTVRNFLTDALRLDRKNKGAWLNLGQFYRDEGPEWAMEAAECFQAAALLEGTAPVEPFR